MTLLRTAERKRAFFMASCVSDNIWKLVNKYKCPEFFFFFFLLLLFVSVVVFQLAEPLQSASLSLIPAVTTPEIAGAPCMTALTASVILAPFLKGPETPRLMRPDWALNLHIKYRKRKFFSPWFQAKAWPHLWLSLPPEQNRAPNTQYFKKLIIFSQSSHPLRAVNAELSHSLEATFQPLTAFWPYLPGCRRRNLLEESAAKTSRLGF